MSAGEVLLEVLTQCVTLVVGCGSPLVAFVLILVFMVVFRKEIPKLLARGEVSALGGTFKWGDASVDSAHELPARIPTVAFAPERRVGDEAGEEAERGAEAGINWENTGSLFGVGTGLIWTVDFLLRDAPTYVIGSQLQSVLTDIRFMGFPSTEVGAAVERKLEEMMERAVEGEWTAERRNSYAAFLVNAAQDIGWLAIQNQLEHGGFPE